MVVTVEIVVAEEEEILAGEVEEVDVVQVDVNKDNSSRRNHPTPRSIKEKVKPQSVKYVGSLATLQISVGTGLHRLVEIHLGVVSQQPRGGNRGARGSGRGAQGSQRRKVRRNG